MPPDKLALGVPARIARDVADEEREYARFAVENYLRLNRRHAGREYPNWSA